MRAMLSRAGVHDANGKAVGAAYAGRMAVSAVFEAERILRETEPAHGWNDCAWPRVGHYATLAEVMGGQSAARPLQGGLALAEALALFIEEA